MKKREIFCRQKENTKLTIGVNYTRHNVSIDAVEVKQPDVNPEKVEESVQSEKNEESFLPKLNEDNIRPEQIEECIHPKLNEDNIQPEQIEECIHPKQSEEKVKVKQPPKFDLRNFDLLETIAKVS